MLSEQSSPPIWSHPRSHWHPTYPDQNCSVGLVPGLDDSRLSEKVFFFFFFGETELVFPGVCSSSSVSSLGSWGEATTSNGWGFVTAPITTLRHDDTSC